MPNFTIVDCLTYSKLQIERIEELDERMTSLLAARTAALVRRRAADTKDQFEDCSAAGSQPFSI